MDNGDVNYLWFHALTTPHQIVQAILHECERGTNIIVYESKYRAKRKHITYKLAS